jgi:ATP-dependent DNA ligase
MLTLINPVPRAEPFDVDGWLFELKFDGFGAAADTVRSRLISRNGHRMKQFEEVPATIVNNAVLFVESRADADDDGYKRH